MLLLLQEWESRLFYDRAILFLVTALFTHDEDETMVLWRKSRVVRKRERNGGRKSKKSWAVWSADLTG